MTDKIRIMVNPYIIKSDFENDLLYLKGSIPGSKNTTVLLRESVKNITKKRERIKIKMDTLQNYIINKVILHRPVCVYLILLFNSCKYF